MRVCRHGYDENLCGACAEWRGWIVCGVAISIGALLGVALIAILRLLVTRG